MQNATEFIKSQVSIYMLMQHYQFKHIQTSENEYRSCCGIHNGNNKTAFVANKNGLWYCHTGECGGGDIFDLVSKKENISFKESVQYISNAFNIDISKMEIVQRTNQIMQDTKNWIETMRSICKQKNSKEFDINILGELYPINSYRNFNKETLQHFNVNFCTNNKRIIIPICFDNKIVGVTMRRTNNHPAKWLHQPTQLTIGNHLLNYDNIEIGDKIILTEGPFDVFNLWQNEYENSVASFHCGLTKEQENLLLKKGYELLIAYDNDNAGRIGTRKVIEAFKNKMNIRIAKIPNEQDIGQLDSKELILAVSQAYTIQEWSEVYGR